MLYRKAKLWTADFETTVFEGQTYTEVWASAICPLGSTDKKSVTVTNNINDFFDFFKKKYGHHIVYFHNIKFDGQFMLYDLKKKGFTEAAHISRHDPENPDNTRIQYVDWYRVRDMPAKTFQYSISEKGLWYTITVKINGRVTVEFRDSLKLVPFSVEALGAAFETKNRKLSMEYEGERHAYGNITEEERDYIKNDVLVMSEVMQKMIDGGHDKLTIGSCCMSEYKELMGKADYDMYFPDVYKDECCIDGFDTVGDFVLRGYNGAWCYCEPGIQGKVLHNGLTYDVNSLYPYVMHSSSGFRYPVGHGKYFEGKLPDDIYNNEMFYPYMRIKCRFQLRKGKLPFLHIRHNACYNPHENLTTSDVYNKKTGKYDRYYIDNTGRMSDTAVEMVVTKYDFELMKAHYRLLDLEFLGGYYFRTEIGLFDDYINHYYELKRTAKTKVERTIAKLYLNNLYGKFATSKDSSFKICGIDPESDILRFENVFADDKDPGYIPVGAAITSHARYYTITAAQKNFHGRGKKGFKYADTDSIHMDIEPEKVVGIEIHSTKLGAWKLETEWDFAVFCRQKMYIEHDRHNNNYSSGQGDKWEDEYIIRCAGMNKRCKKNFIDNCLGRKKETPPEWEAPFWKESYTWRDFNIGLRVPGKLTPKKMPGGVVLMNDWFEAKEL